MIIRVPASTANMGPGFDAVACALQWYATVCLAPSAEGEAPVDERHPTAQAFTRAGGEGPIWVPSSLPMGRGLGSSAALRLGGVIAALVQRHGPEVDPRHPQHQVLDLVTELEGHADNAAAALFGGLVVTAAGAVVTVPLPQSPSMVMWVPDTVTRTAASRRTLPATVTFDDAVYNVGRAALLVAAAATGRWDALDIATRDHLHQDRRLAEHPQSRHALEVAREAGASGVWLSGSGPTVACWCEPGVVDTVVAALPSNGRVRVVAIDHAGAMILPDG